MAIIKADECRKCNDREGTFLNIKRGLTYNYKNYELYFMLGEYYLSENLQKAYLCFENAAFFCNDSDDLAIINQAKKNLEDNEVSVPKISIIILSYNAKDEMKLCLESLRRTVSKDICEIIVIDNASSDGVTNYLKEQKDITLVCNKRNVGFPSGCNQGINLANSENDILLLNNDTVVTENAIFWLRMGLYEDNSIGATGSVSNNVSNYQKIEANYDTAGEYLNYALDHNIPMEYPYEQKLRLVGFALLIKRKVLNEIGLLDECFSPGNCEDDDISLRMINAGYKLLLCKNSFIFHFGSVGFGKDHQKYNDLLRTNAQKFKNKWGFDIRYYCYERRNVAEFIEDDADAHINVLEVGCGMGATLGYIRNKYYNSKVYGIEIESSIAEIAKKYINNAVCGNIETMQLPYERASFDYVIFADVLEHLINPETVLKKIREYLKPSGYVLASIPNIMHYSVILDLLKGNFTYQDSGILDKTHMRFFTLKEIEKMFNRCGYRIVSISVSYDEENLQEEDNKLLEKIISLPNVADQSNFYAYQYLIKAEVCKEMNDGR